jgi:hypothetical protein
MRSDQVEALDAVAIEVHGIAVEHGFHQGERSAMDTAIALGISIGKAVRRKSEYSRTREFMHKKLA